MTSKLRLSSKSNKMPVRKNPVVASLGNQSLHPYTSIAISPNRQYAVVAGKDTLRLLAVGPNGLSLVRSLPISQVRIEKEPRRVRIRDPMTSFVLQRLDLL